MAQDKTLDLIEYRRHLESISGGYHFTVPSGQLWEILNRAIDAEAKVAELVDALGSKPSGPCGCEGSTPSLGTKEGSSDDSVE